MVDAVQPFVRTPQPSLPRPVEGRHVFTIPGLSGDMVASFSAMSWSAMQELLGLQDVRGQVLPARTDAGKASGIAAAASTAGPACSTPFVAANYGKYVGRSTGSGQCVALVQAASPGIGATRKWSCGDLVKGNTSLQPGTVIATFNGANRYANATNGSSHAAIYLGQNERGIQVLDQWSGSAAAVRTIPWRNPSGMAANTGRAFHVVRSA